MLAGEEAVSFMEPKVAPRHKCGEGADKRPETTGGSEGGAREIEGRHLAGNGGENGYNSGGRSANPVIEFDTLEVREGQASMSGCFENGCRDVSGVVACKRPGAP